MCSYWLYFLIIFFLNFKLLDHINCSQYTISPLHCRLMRWVLFDIKFVYVFIIFLTKTYHLIIFLPYFIFPFPEITRTYTTTVITLPHVLKLIVHCLKSIVVGMIFDIQFVYVLNICLINKQETNYCESTERTFLLCILLTKSRTLTMIVNALPNLFQLA